jgi:DNA-binding beta-propeller fold protein YncE
MAIGLTGGCRPSGDAHGVVGAFGRMGLGPGDFTYPRAIAVAPDGHVFVVDKSGRVQRFSPDGEYETGWKMPRTATGVPVGLSVHPDGRLFVPDTHNHRVQVFDRDGVLLAEFGSEGDGPGEFSLPTDVAFDAAGNVYVAEYYLTDRISRWSPDLKFIQSFGEEPIDGLRLTRPSGIAVDREQTLWVSDACNHRIVQFSLDGKVLRTFGEFGAEPGKMRYPYDLCITPDDTIMICEFEGDRLQWFDKTGRSLRVWGERGREVGQVASPWGAAYGPDGRIYIVDSRNDRVQILQP